MPFHMHDDSVPTREEVKLAQPLLELLENKLEQLRAATTEVESQIAQHKAWGAPVRRVTADALSLVFIECASGNWEIPLVLGAICRRWRKILLDTPRVWAFLSITHISPPFRHELLDLWLSRCGALKLHVSLRYLALRSAVKVVCSHEKNLQCLSLFGHAKELMSRFSELEELRLGGPIRRIGQSGFPSDLVEAYIDRDQDMKENDSLLSVDLFPKLQSLHLHSPHHLTMRAIATASQLPPLHTLHIHMSSPYWLHIIGMCADTLVTLILEVPPNFKNQIADGRLQEFTTTLPRLQNLAYYRFAEYALGDIPVPLLGTPALRCYYEANGQGVSPLHRDTASVAFASFVHPEQVDWSSLPRLTKVRFKDSPGGIMEELEKLQVNAKLCPELSSVECAPTFTVLGSREAGTIARRFMEQRSEKTGKRIDFKYISSTEEFNINVVNQEDYFMCFTFCSCDGPGRLQQDFYGERSIGVDEDEDEDEDEDNEDEDGEDEDEDDSSNDEE